jgi:DNA adenine methylase
VTADTLILPFLKWPGGKRWASDAIVALVREKLQRTYYEPFLGGGSIFFALRPELAVISDINRDLINTYRVVRDHAPDIIARLKRLRVDQETFSRIRALEPRDPIRRAVRFLYLNRTAFGGIYRLNRSGKFNVPFGGGQRTPEVLWREGLLLKASALLLSGARIRHADFEPIMEHAENGDVVYCDPTYTVAHENNGFLRYNERNFSWADQVRLADAARRAVSRGATVIISNAEHHCIRQLYNGADLQILQRHSTVSSSISGRRPVRELLIYLKPSASNILRLSTTKQAHAAPPLCRPER